MLVVYSYAAKTVVIVSLRVGVVNEQGAQIRGEKVILPLETMTYLGQRVIGKFSLWIAPSADLEYHLTVGVFVAM